MAEVICSSCGARNPAGTEFCLACGTYLNWDESEGDAAAAPPAPTPTGPTAPPVPPQPPVVAQQPPVPTSPIAPSPTPSPTPSPAPAPPPTPPPAAGQSCPRCGTTNPPELRFCSKCGFVLQQAETATLPRTATAPQRRAGWWQRLTGRADGADPSAVRAYRRSLSGRSRWFRYALAVVVLALVAGALTIAGRNPATVARHLKNGLTNKLVPVEGVTAVSMNSANGRVLDMSAVVDLNRATAWTTRWLGNDAVATAACGPVTKAALSSLQLTLPRETEIRRLRYVGSVPDEATRAHQWIPRALQLTFSDGTCLRVPVTSNGETEPVKLPKPVRTDSLHVEIVAADKPQSPPPPPGLQTISISEIQLLSRPS